MAIVAKIHTDDVGGPPKYGVEFMGPGAFVLVLWEVPFRPRVHAYIVIRPLQEQDQDGKVEITLEKAADFVDHPVWKEFMRHLCRRHRRCASVFLHHRLFPAAWSSCLMCAVRRSPPYPF
jgi:hypothetical protein